MDMREEREKNQRKGSQHSSQANLDKEGMALNIQQL